MTKQLNWLKPSQVASNYGYPMTKEQAIKLDKSFLGTQWANSQGFILTNADTVKQIMNFFDHPTNW